MARATLHTLPLPNNLPCDNGSGDAKLGCGVARLVNPVLFSQRFGIKPAALERAGLLDPVLNSDTKLFIDPVLLPRSANKLISKEAYAALRTAFSEIVKLVAASQQPNDVAWRNAAKRLNLSERPETGLGYGGASTSGASRPNDIKQKVLSTAKEIVTLGENDPEIISLMGLFEEGIGPDTISDLATNIILTELSRLTTSFCESQNIATKAFAGFASPLPPNPFRTDRPIILVPKDILRDLPIAVDWSDISRVVGEIEEIRDRFNRLVGGIAKATVSERKDALKRAALSSLENFQNFFHEFLASSDTYDPNDDILNFYAFRRLITADLTAYGGTIKPAAAPTRAELQRIVTEIIGHFRQLVEKNNMWELLWTPVFCKANNIDISPETNSGGGPVDFKFSKGYANRVVVEVKRSLGTVEHGYKVQTEKYKDAANTDAAIFMIIDVGGMGQKLANIKKHQSALTEKGIKASQIEVVDAKRRKSASKS
jgi:hypothetical protein